MPPKKVYIREFKLETLRLLKSSGKTKADLERELGLYPGQIQLWLGFPQRRTLVHFFGGIPCDQNDIGSLEGPQFVREI
jgi:hypothetical protein